MGTWGSVVGAVLVTRSPFQRQERGVDFSTTVECEMELHQAHPVAMLRRASRRSIDIRGAVSKY